MIMIEKKSEYVYDALHPPNPENKCPLYLSLLSKVLSATQN